MLLLTIDTSGKNGSLGLARVEQNERGVELIDVMPLAGGTFSAQLVPQIAALLAQHRYTKFDLDGFAVISGPGSFTGLRVGLAAVKALAEVLHKPIAAISLLEAVAASVTSSGHVFAALDAGRGEVYVGEYEAGDVPKMASERLLIREELVSETKAGNRTIVTPDAATAEILRAASIACEKVAYPGAEVIARLGWRHILKGDAVSPDALEANYIRRSDAEVFSQPHR
ncbi:MAG TPA: tRNA (adenosine(37)-N6)-threonylcarbamoyltransferase complex dimerization subunit type 1 TsaB [Terriglobales bacterium]|nr:tRNA (adenosine(37)-N6)-threonylcarbamoyltransferase complex dimerization subunit type 1 TsaB [Terriglobales bacterium]